ncbi:ABC transporter permease [Brenneria sp. 4F2]|nr:ABC transporter permease [Brenneria bubanii]
MTMVHQGKITLRQKQAAHFHYRLQPGLIAACLVLLTAVLWAIVPGWFTAYSPTDGIAGAQRLAPGGDYSLGTDQLGRDLYARIVYGSVHTLSGAAIAVGLGLVLGSLLGLLAGAVGGWLDSLIMRFIDILLAIPSLLLALSIIILLGFGTVNAAIAVGITSVASFTRLVRAEALRVRRSDYVEAAYGSGGSFFSVLWRHILPNTLSTVLAFAALQFGSAILAISTLSFLGYGAPPPTPEWGLLIAEGRNYLSTAWWLTTFPGLVVVLVVLSANRISQSLRRDRS